MVDVTFRGKKPTSAIADETVRRCIALVADTKLVTDEMMGVAWWSSSGREDDDETIELTDSSTALVWSPTTKTIVTMQERSGEKLSGPTIQADDSSRSTPNISAPCPHTIVLPR
jgi:hypothetical protein